MSGSEAPLLSPGRAEVAAQWLALARGEVTREAVHAWAVPWVECEDGADFEDPLVLTALQYLHGFDLGQTPDSPDVIWHGASGEGEWYHPLDDAISGFARWQENCALYDADPQGCIRMVRERAMAFIRAEEARNESR